MRKEAHEKTYRADVLILWRMTCLTQPVLSSPFAYRLLYKNSQTTQFSSRYDPFCPPKFVGNVINIAERALVSRFHLPAALFLLLRTFVPGKMSPTTSRRDPVRFPRRALFGASWFGVCHAAAILGPLASIRVRVAHVRASDTAVTNDIVEPAYGRRGLGAVSLHLASETRTVQVLSGPTKPRASSGPGQHLTDRSAG